jgi:hypothetical protein
MHRPPRAGSNITNSAPTRRSRITQSQTQNLAGKTVRDARGSVRAVLHAPGSPGSCYVIGGQTFMRWHAALPPLPCLLSLSPSLLAQLPARPPRLDSVSRRDSFDSDDDEVQRHRNFSPATPMPCTLHPAPSVPSSHVPDTLHPAPCTCLNLDTSTQDSGEQQQQVASHTRMPAVHSATRPGASSSMAYRGGSSLQVFFLCKFGVIHACVHACE